jgi:hypothetical protein
LTVAFAGTLAFMEGSGNQWLMWETHLDASMVDDGLMFVGAFDRLCGQSVALLLRIAFVLVVKVIVKRILAPQWKSHHALG